MEQDPWLFQGEMVNGRLSNEASLLRDCPPEFFDPDNQWYACTLMHMRMRNGGRVSELKPWNTQQFYASDRANALEAHRRKHVFGDLLNSHRSSLRNEQRAAVLAWMLSEILTEAPRCVPAKPMQFQYHTF